MSNNGVILLSIIFVTFKIFLGIMSIGVFALLISIIPSIIIYFIYPRNNSFKYSEIFKKTFIASSPLIFFMVYLSYGRGEVIGLFFFSIIFIAFEIIMGTLIISVLAILSSIIPSTIIYFIYSRNNNFLKYKEIFKKTFVSFLIFFMIYLTNYNLLSNKNCSIGFDDLFFGTTSLFMEHCVKITNNYTVKESGVFTFIFKDGKSVYTLDTSFTVHDNDIIIEKEEHNYTTFENKIVGYDVLNMDSNEIKNIKSLSDINITKPLKFYGLKEYSKYKRGIYGLNDFIILLLSFIVSFFILKRVLKHNFH